MWTSEGRALQTTETEDAEVLRQEYACDSRGNNKGASVAGVE